MRGAVAVVRVSACDPPMCASAPRIAEPPRQDLPTRRAIQHAGLAPHIPKPHHHTPRSQPSLAAPHPDPPAAVPTGHKQASPASYTNKKHCPPPHLFEEVGEAGAGGDDALGLARAGAVWQGPPRRRRLGLQGVLRGGEDAGCVRACVCVCVCAAAASAFRAS